jgi:hypothetical protein
MQRRWPVLAEQVRPEPRPALGEEAQAELVARRRQLVESGSNASTGVESD